MPTKFIFDACEDAIIDVSKGTWLFDTFVNQLPLHQLVKMAQALGVMFPTIGELALHYGFRVQIDSPDQQRLVFTFSRQESECSE